METYFIKAYLIYLPIVIVLTYFVATTLFKSGGIFISDIFKGREEIAKATNQLFKVGFYLLNLGFGLLIMEIHHHKDGLFDSNREVIETLSGKIGVFAVYLGAMLFFNLFLFFRGRKKANQAKNLKLDLGHEK